MFKKLCHPILSAACTLFLMGQILLPHPTRAEGLKVYIDADFSISVSVARAVELGLKTALAQGGNMLAGQPVTVVSLDHRGNPRRSQANIQRFQRDPNAIAVFGGMESPPYLTFGENINLAGIPLLLPWSAAAPITRKAQGDENFIFRLSVDDSKAGKFLVKSAASQGCTQIALMLIDTGWGRANDVTMSAALEAESMEAVIKINVPSDVGPLAAKNIARDLAASGADCAISVMTSDPSIKVFNAMYELSPDVRVFSHWGMISPAFPTSVPFAVRERLSFRLLQTCGLQVETRGSTILSGALETARTIGAEVQSLRDVGAPAGFVHAYDLGLILQAAAEQAASDAAWTSDTAARRRALRDAIEALETPVNGILAAYDPPFAAVTETDLGGHEALGGDRLCLAQYDDENRLKAVEFSNDLVNSN